MGRFGVHAGSLKAKSVKTDGKHVLNREIIRIPCFMTQTCLNDSGTTAAIGGKTAAVLTGVSMGGIGAKISTPAYAFSSGTGNTDRAVHFHTVVPSSVPRDASLIVRPYWTCMSGGANTYFLGSGVVWDVDYMITPLAPVSGIVRGRSRQISSTVTNATDSVTYLAQAGLLSGVVCGANIRIPKGKILPDAYVNCILFRDGSEAADDLGADVYLLAVALEYVKY